jgi:glycerol-3-phosphate acyltransferase PlsY
MITNFLFVLLAFLSGSLPFSVWIGRWALQTDIRGVGDGNPGATNVWKAGSKAWGVLAVLLDFAKGAVPVAIFHYGLGGEGGWLTAVSLAPILGHAFSPFLRFRGGKALAVTFGVWTGLTLWFGPTVLGVAFAVWLIILRKDVGAVLLGMGTLLLVLLLVTPDPVYIWVWVGNFLILAWKHRKIRSQATAATVV